MTRNTANPEATDYQPVFIVGSPRSGTTLTGRILDAHPRAATFFVPYFVWERGFQDRPDDRLTSRDADPRTIHRIRREFARVARHSNAEVVIDQSPRNSLRIDFVRKVFPNARFIHVIRDGRDAVISINKEWRRRQASLHKGGIRPGLILRALKEHTDAQPLLRHKIAALLFELGGLRGPYSLRRWDGMTGWGPRFPGWREAYASSSMLLFNAQQWRACNETAETDLATIPEDHRLMVRYEELLAEPEAEIQRMLAFTGLDDVPAFRENLPSVNRDNSGKWERELAPEDANAVTRALSAPLQRWGYLPGNEEDSECAR